MKTKKTKTAFKAGDVLEATIRFDSIGDDEFLEEAYRLLILHVIKEESDAATNIVYTFVMEPVNWESPYELTLGTNMYTFPEEDLLEHKPKKVGHIDISPLLKA